MALGAGRVGKSVGRAIKAMTRKWRQNCSQQVDRAQDGRRPVRARAAHSQEPARLHRQSWRLGGFLFRRPGVVKTGGCGMGPGPGGGGALMVPQPSRRRTQRPR